MHPLMAPFKFFGKFAVCQNLQKKFNFFNEFEFKNTLFYLWLIFSYIFKLPVSYCLIYQDHKNMIFWRFLVLSLNLMLKLLWRCKLLEKLCQIDLSCFDKTVSNDGSITVTFKILVSKSSSYKNLSNLP